MKNWVIKLIADYIAKNVSEEDMKAWVAAIQSFVMPKLRAWKDMLIASLKDLAAQTDNDLVDTVVDLVDRFLEALLPDSPATLADV